MLCKNRKKLKRRKYSHSEKKTSTTIVFINKSCNFALPFQGEMAEWSIASVLKTDVLRGTGGSNPSLSARNKDLLEFASPFFVFTD